ncbi:MAG: single-stranded DNA-binding protein [Streptococcaceae bacterium]|nr:single-stranded DNA-binding protein [Streptococcaceae bacterium]
MMNNVQLIGRLVGAPELAKTPKDRNYCRTTLAVNRRYKNSEGEHEADFVTVIFWGKLAETLGAYGKKGMLISINGQLHAYSYEGKDQVRHYRTEVIADNFQMLESRTTVARREALAVQGEVDTPVLAAEELPF